MLRALFSAAKAYLAVKAVEMAANAFAGRKGRKAQASAKPRRMAKAARRPATRTKAAT
jgi:hypothetical protein